MANFTDEKLNSTAQEIDFRDEEFNQISYWCTPIAWCDTNAWCGYSYQNFVDEKLNSTSEEVDFVDQEVNTLEYRNGKDYRTYFTYQGGE